MTKLSLMVERDGDRILLVSPEVGQFTRALKHGSLLSSGATAGVVRSLERSFELIVPEGVSGRVVSRRPERVNEPVGYGAVLYELAPLRTAEGDAADEFTDEEADAGPVFRAPHSGRFWHRPTPDDPAFVEAGAVIQAGQTLGLIEVMKTFTQLAYSTEDGLPERARVTRVCVGDGVEVTEGDPLFEVEEL